MKWRTCPITFWPHLCRSAIYCAVLPKRTLFKVLYFIFAKFKNYTLFILFFQSNTLFKDILSKSIKITYDSYFFPKLSDTCQQFIDQWAYPKNFASAFGARICNTFVFQAMSF